jgi:hypothetical protein
MGEPVTLALAGNIGSVVQAVAAVPGGITATMDLVKSLKDVKYAEDIDLSGVKETQFFYMVSQDGNNFLGQQTGELDGDNDPIPTKLAVKEKYDLLNHGIKFVFMNGQLYCKSGKFKEPTRTHVFGPCDSDKYVFSAWDSNLKRPKYKWDVVEIDGKVAFKSEHTEGYLTAEIEKGTHKGRIHTTSEKSWAYIAIFCKD